MSFFRVRFELVSCFPEQTPSPALVPQGPSDARRRSKSKLGCRQCKAKRVKCDETFPVCLRCRRQSLVCSSTPRLTPWQYEAPWVTTPLDGHINQRLLRHWVARVSQMLVLDPDDNPYSFPILEHVTSSHALLHIIQSISARHEQFFSPQASILALEERVKSLVSLRQEMDRLDVSPQTSFLTAGLLAISHGADRDMADYGKQHLFAARILVGRILQKTSNFAQHDSLSWLCLGMYLYWDMNAAFLVDPDEDQNVNALDLLIAVHRMGHRHHPMYGYCTQLLFTLADLGRYCRQISHSLPRNATKEAMFEQQLLSWNATSASSSLVSLYEALRLHGLIVVYRASGDNELYANPALSSMNLESLIHHYALETVHRLLEIPMASNLLNFQSLLLLTAGSELNVTESHLRDQVLQRLRAIYSLNRLPANLHVVQLLQEIWEMHDDGNPCFWLHHMLHKGWRLLLG